MRAIINDNKAVLEFILCYQADMCQYLVLRRQGRMVIMFDRKSAV